MNENLPLAFQAIAPEVIFKLAGFVGRLSTPEERGGAALLLAEIIKMRDPSVAALVAQEAEKAAARKGRE